MALYVVVRAYWYPLSFGFGYETKIAEMNEPSELDLLDGNK
jgi:hypothetical protein